MKRWTFFLTAAALLGSTCAGDTFKLEHRPSGRTFGPFELKEGEEVVIGKASFHIFKMIIAWSWLI